MNDKLRFIIYVRKSEEREERQVLSPESQLEECQVVVDTDHLTIVKTFEEHQSAKFPGRPKFNEMMDMLRNGEADGILCWAAHRLSRNAKDSGELQWLMDDSGIVIRTPKQTYDRDNSSTAFKMDTGSAEKFSKDLSDNVRRGNRTHFKEGYWLSLAYMGYLNYYDEMTEDSYLVKDPERFPLVRKMWDLLLTGNHSIPDIARVADTEWGYRSKKRRKSGNKPVSTATLYRMFRNPFYYGLMIRRIDGELKQGWGKHDPMITKAEFDRAQEILGNDGVPKRANTEHLMGLNAGLMHCGECGGAITFETHKKKYKNGTSDTFVYARCTKRKTGFSCKQPYLPLEELNNQVERVLSQLELSPRFRDWAVNQLREQHAEEIKEDETITATLNNSLSDTRGRKGRLLDVYLEDQTVMTKDEYHRRLALLDTEEAKLVERLADRDYQRNRWFEIAEKTLDFANASLQTWKFGNPKERREILRVVGGSNLILKDKVLQFQPVAPYIFLQKSHDKIVAFSSGGPGGDRTHDTKLNVPHQISLAPA